MIETKESKTRDIPIWLTALVIVLCIGGGAWLVKWYMKEQPKQVVIIPDDRVLPNNARGIWRGQPNVANGNGNNGFRAQPQRDINANGVQSWSKNSYRAKVGDTVMMVIYNANGNGHFDISPQYLTMRTPAEAEMAVMRMSILSDASWRDHLKVTDDQLEKLRKVPAPKSMTLDPADREKLSELWKAYHDGAADKKAAAEKELLAGLDEVGKKNLAATKAYEATRAELVRAALTPEQIKLYQDAGGKAPVPKEPLVVPAKVEPKIESKPAAEKTLIEGTRVLTPEVSKTVLKATDKQTGAASTEKLTTGAAPTDPAPPAPPK
jgi:hypothetical protein